MSLEISQFISQWQLVTRTRSGLCTRRRAQVPLRLLLRQGFHPPALPRAAGSSHFSTAAHVSCSDGFHLLEAQALVAREAVRVHERIVSALLHHVRGHVLEAVRIGVVQHGLAIQLGRGRGRGEHKASGLHTPVYT